MKRHKVINKNMLNMTRIYQSEVNKTVGGEAGQLEGQCVVDLSAMLTVAMWTLQ